MPNRGHVRRPNRHTLYMHDVPLLCECKDCGRQAAAECARPGDMTPLARIRAVCSHCGSRNVWRGMAWDKARTEEWLAGDLSRAKLEPPHEDALSRGVKD